MGKIIFKIGLCLLSILIVSYHVYLGTVNLYTFIIYLFSIGTCIWFLKDLAFNKLFNKKKLQTDEKFQALDVALIVILIILYLSLLQYFSHFPGQIHGDELVTAEVSFYLPPIDKINWFAGYPPNGWWVAEFPVYFFILQKPFFSILGPSLAAIHLSAWPYHILIVIFLYLLSKEYFSSRFFAFLTVFILGFLAPNLYISSLGLHFYSSTLFLLASVYFLIRLFKTRERKYSLLCGMFTAFSYLMYTSSYIVLPIVLTCTAIQALTEKSIKPVKLVIPALVLFMVIMLPFGIYAATKVNYFGQRIGQVNFISGEWGDTQKKVQSGETIWSLITAHIVKNFQALYTKDIGGQGGYHFGYQALFNPLTAILLLIGFIVCVVEVGRMCYGVSGDQNRLLKRNFLIFVLIVVAASLANMVLSWPAGAFHRSSLMFPFIALIITIGIVFVSQKIKFKHISQIIVILLTAAFVITNFNTAISMIPTGPDEFSNIANYIEEHFPEGTHFDVAAYGSYVIERAMLFLLSNKYSFHSDRHVVILSENNGTRPIIVLTHLPEYISTLNTTFPNGTFIGLEGDPYFHSHFIFIPSNYTNVTSILANDESKRITEI